MKIQVGKYTLRSDQFCMWIDEEHTRESGEKVTRRVTGYATSFRTLLSSFRQRKVMGVDAESLVELINALSVIMSDMDELNKAAVEKGFKLAKKAVRGKKDGTVHSKGVSQDSEDAHQDHLQTRQRGKAGTSKGRQSGKVRDAGKGKQC